MLKWVGFVLGVILSAVAVFALSGNGGRLLHPIMASVQSPFKEMGIPAVQGLVEGKEKDDEAIVPIEMLPEPGEVKDIPVLPEEVKHPNPVIDDQSNPPPGDTDTPQQIQARYFKLWSPFHSMHAAKGFADRLAEVADVSVDIQRTGVGRFQVMLLYQSEPERLASIERIERLTGLKIH